MASPRQRTVNVVDDDHDEYNIDASLAFDDSEGYSESGDGGGGVGMGQGQVVVELPSVTQSPTKKSHHNSSGQQQHQQPESGLVFDDSEYSDSEGCNKAGGGGGGIMNDNASSRSSSASGSNSTLGLLPGQVRKRGQYMVGHAYTVAMRRLRVVLWLVLLSIMVLSSSGIYFFSLQRDQSAFVTDFSGYASKVLDSFQGDAHRKLEALDSLSAFLSVFAIDHNDSWPFVTMSHSAPLLERYLTVMGAEAVKIVPLVPHDMRAEWEAYALEYGGWIDEALEETAYSTDKSGHEEEEAHHDDHHLLNRRWLSLNQQQPSTSAGSKQQLLRQIEHTNKQGFNRRSSSSNGQNKKTNASVVEHEDSELVSTLMNLLSNNGSSRMIPYIHDDTQRETSGGPLYAVGWQYAPVAEDRFLLNYNHFARPKFAKETASVIEKQLATLSHSYTYCHENTTKAQLSRVDAFLSDLLDQHTGHSMEGEAFFDVHYPVFAHFNNHSQTKAIIVASVYWKTVFEAVLPKEVHGIVCVVENSLGQVLSYQIDGHDATFLGMVDAHDPHYEHLAVTGSYMDVDHDGGMTIDDHISVSLDADFMTYSIRVYPSSEMERMYQTNTPAIVASAMVFLFLVTATIFKMYDVIIARRQDTIESRAAKTEDIVASLFPETVRARIMGDASVEMGTAAATSLLTRIGGKAMSSGQSVGSTHTSMTATPDASTVIADFYPEVTVLFTDIKGFTAWCSEREPCQVFILLESLYNMYDTIARKRKVFKVETIGDCYMAVAGLPVARADHAVIMARFARECMRKVDGLLQGLEMTLGPGTADLSMRFGLHSGPVTAGVIRSQNARFQLFGDTVNTASRMESTGEAGMIQISQQTAEELTSRGKGHWCVPRQDQILAKGKGKLQTFWLNLLVSDDDNQSASTPSVTSTPAEPFDTASTTGGGGTAGGEPIVQQRRASEVGGQRTTVSAAQTASRLVDWNVEALSRLLEQIAVRRTEQRPSSAVPQMEPLANSYDLVTESNGTVPVVELAVFDAARATGEHSELDAAVMDQLHQFVHTISTMYDEHAFHNFEHASHVALSVIKLLGRIVIPNDIEPGDARHAFSDPLTQFTCVLGALIHDVWHSGVPNAQLVIEKAEVASQYYNCSIAEQASIDVAWQLLMQPDYDALRSAIYCDQEEMDRFRYLLVHAVMATDISDARLKEARNKQWDLAFNNDDSEEASPQQVSSRKAVIVVQTLIQASDLSHTMQHWHVYQKWNQRLFDEMMTAYRLGRSDKDPSEGWYEGELWFFENVVIPLAKRLKDCGVFGVSSEEYLNYAIRNCEEWKACGSDAVREMQGKLINRATSRSEIA